MRTLIFSFVIALTLVGCPTSAEDSYGKGGGSGYGAHGGHGGHGGPGYGPHPPEFSYKDLHQLENYIHSVGAEKLQARKRVTMLKAQKTNLLTRLEWVRNDIIAHFWSVQGAQDENLAHIKNEIKALRHTVGEHEGILAGELELAHRQEDLVNPRWTRINDLVETNNKQIAFLTKLEFLLKEAKEKLYEKLNVSETEAKNEVSELKYNTLAVAEWTNTRHCYKGSIVVEINQNGTGQETVYYPHDFFHGLTPTAFCDLHGFTAHLNPKRSHAFGYQDKYQCLGVTVDCKPFEKFLEVSLFHNSRGDYNEVKSASVHYKLCTVGPQAGV